MKEPEVDLLKKFGFEEDDFLREALLELKNLEKPPTSKEDAWARFEQTLLEKSVAPAPVRFLPLSIIWKIAASVILIISLGFGFQIWNNVNISTVNNQIQKVTLPDQSVVTLNAATNLSYHKFRWSASRKVNLSGEALFSVTKGNHFEITTLGKTITVLGTEFNVFSRAAYFEVKCLSGKVAVQIPGKNKLLLTKGQGVRQDILQKSIAAFKVTNGVSTWIQGDFYYQDADLNLVLDELGRQFNVHIQKGNFNRRYTGFFNKSDLGAALNRICLPMGLTYSVSKDTVAIR